MNLLLVFKRSILSRQLLAIVAFLLVAAVLAVSFTTIADIENGHAINDQESYIAGQAYYQQVSVESLELEDNYAIERLYSGRVKAQQHAQISFEMPGKVGKVYVDVGDKVKRGQKLAQLDTTQLKIEKRQLNAQINEAKAKMDLLQSNLKRQYALKDSGFSSQQTLDELQAEEKSLIAMRQQLEARLDLVDFNLRRATLKAPFTGSITARFVDSGHVVNAGQSIVRVQQSGKMEVAVGVPIHLTYKLKEGQQYPVTIAGQQYLSTLMGISTDLQQATRTVLLRLRLPEKAVAFNGDIAELNLTEAISQPGYWVPATAVTDGVRGLWSLYVVKASSSKALPVVLEKRDVAIHHANSEHYFVSGPIHAGEKVVTNGLHKLVPGQKVRLQQVIHNTDSYQL